jgi:hypothetical protein
MPQRLPPAAPLPGDAIALHIGIHKTGTTALQSALADARPELAEHGVLYPGRKTAQHGAAMSILERPWGWAGKGGKAPNPRVFERIAREARRHRGRVLISSEQFCEADDRMAARVVDGLGADRTHVIVALRNLGRLLPSSWQQYLKYGRTTTYERWLKTMFDPEYDGSMTPTFWRRNDHGALVTRWTNMLGPDRVTVLVLEDVTDDALFVAFAELLDVPPGVLTSRMHQSPNRSMSAVESEFLRRVNRAVKDSIDWQDYEDFVRDGVAAAIVAGRRPAPDEPRLHTPDWALDAAAARAAVHAAAIRASGARVLGDLDALTARVASTPPVPRATLDALSTDAVVEVVANSVLAQSGQPRPKDPWETARRVRNGIAARLPHR